jgi:hypothetical protein
MDTPQETATLPQTSPLTFQGIATSQIIEEATQLLAAPKLIIGASLADVQKLQRVQDFLADLRLGLGIDGRVMMARSSEWPKYREAWLKLHNFCAACGRKEYLEVHHKTPLNWGRRRA